MRLKGLNISVLPCSAAYFSVNVGQQPFDHGQHILAVDKAHLHVELGELRLAVGALVFIAEAARDLEITLDAGHHQQLLELLRALRQGVELARMHAAGHQILARAFGRALEQNRRLDFEEAAARRDNRG